MTSELYERFNSALDQHDKDTCLQLAMDAVDHGQIGIPDLYENILAPALNNIAPLGQRQMLPIWQEHLRTHIVETVIACCGRIISSKANPQGLKVLTFCPVDEYHQVGAKMASDFFSLCGYRVYYIGANTPAHQFLDAIATVDPQYVAISISSVYHLPTTKRAIGSIRSQYAPAAILVGGQAFAPNPKAYHDIGADRLLSSYDDILSLAKEDGLR